jgi:predicted alpha/beta-fold hydrolase
MPIVCSSFLPPVFLRNGHVQTILPLLLPRRLEVQFERERLELDDGDFLDLDWARAGRGRLVIVTHGLESGTTAGYVRGAVATLQAAGWDALAWNFRGCGTEPNRLARFYHSGETGDLSSVIRHAAASYERIALIGFSLGGNVTLKYLGEAPSHPAVIAAAAISTPVDLASSARALDQRRTNRIYLRHFLRTLIAKVEAKARHFPDQLDVASIRTIGSFQEFDDRYTAPLHGFRDAADYYSRSSALPYLPKITIPMLLLNARNDPFLTPECFPHREAEANAQLFLETPSSGGHVGFMDFANGSQPWSERRVAHFFENQWHRSRP